MARFVENSNGLLVPESLAASDRAAVYCDESGNSGPNYIDSAQPFYVLAGWLVPEERTVEVSVAIDKFRKQHFRQRDELKSLAVLRNDNTKRMCADLFATLGKLHCVPLYLIAEKRFCVAGKIVETFLDPEYHEFLKHPFTTDIETKQEIANTLYERLPDTVITQFAEAYRAPTATALEQALRRVMEVVEANVSPELGKAIAGSMKFIDKIAQVEAETSPLGDVAGTLNMPCLVSFLMLVENLGRQGGIRPIKVLHDQQHAYEEGYKRIFEMHKGLPRLFAPLPDEDMPFTNLENVAEFEMRDSMTSLPIQAADLLAGAIHHCCRLAMGGVRPTPGDHALAQAILPGLLVPRPRLTWLICSEHCVRALGSRVLKPAIRALDSSLTESDSETRIAESLAPMFPLKGGNGKPADGIPRVPFDLPLFGLVGKNGGNLMVVNNDDATEEPLQRYLLLFRSRDLAEKVLSAWEPEELNQPQEVMPFGPRELPDLIHLLENATTMTEYAAIDAGSPGPLRMMLLQELISDLKRILNRIIRTFRSGMDKIMIQKHKIGAVEVLTIQTKDGRYGAMIQPEGKIYFGVSREEAIEMLRKNERL